ncbi:MAG TPA: discoidin domain-containing protein, partial [Bryobacteraceae bacterium]
SGFRTLVDGRPDTWWAAEVAQPELDFKLPKPVTFSVIRIGEAIQFGQRIDAVAVERWDSGAWDQIATATSIGPRRLIRLDKPVTAARVRLRVTSASAIPVLSEFGLFAEPTV